MNKPFWTIRNLAGGNSSAELLLYGDIAPEASWWNDVNSPKEFNDSLARLGNVKNITVRINSRGGDIFAAHAIYNSLVQHSAKITVRIDGLAASAATIVMLAGDDIIMPENAMIMIHNPWTAAQGDEHVLRGVADMLNHIRESMLAVAETRTGTSKEELAKQMDVQTWMTASEAVAAGWADSVEKNVKVTKAFAQNILNIGGLDLDLSNMRMIPMALLAGANESVSTPDEGDGDNTASAAAEQNNQEDITMSGNAQQQPAAQPAPAPEQPQAAAPVAEDERAKILAADRARVSVIQALAEPGAEEIIKAAIENGDTAEATALKILTSQDVKNARALAARTVDAQAAAGVEGGAAAPEADAKEAVVAKMATAGNKHSRFIRGGGVR